MKKPSATIRDLREKLRRAERDRESYRTMYLQASKAHDVVSARLDGIFEALHILAPYLPPLEPKGEKPKT